MAKKISDNELIRLLMDAAQDAFNDLAPIVKKEILKAFDKEYGYDDQGRAITWDGLDSEYVTRYRNGKFHPILVVEGDLRKSIEVIVKGLSIETGVFSTKPKKRFFTGTTPLSDVSSFLKIKRPHTGIPVAKVEKEAGKLFNKYFKKVFDNLFKEGRL